VPPRHFSILIELIQALIAPMEALGYTLPEDTWTSMAEGRMFHDYLREHRFEDADLLPNYLHFGDEGHPTVRAKALPDQLLASFRHHLREVWLPQMAERYFEEHDPRALPFLRRLMPPKRKMD